MPYPGYSVVAVFKCGMSHLFKSIPAVLTHKQGAHEIFLSWKEEILFLCYLLSKRERNGAQHRKATEGSGSERGFDSQWTLETEHSERFPVSFSLCKAMEVCVILDACIETSSSG